MIHNSSDVQSSNIGAQTNIWQYCVILPGAKIGHHCNICAHCFIENDVTIGNYVTIKNGVQLWDGLRVEDNVFIGPNATFSNDTYPKSGNTAFTLKHTRICTGASIGAGAVILPGITIGAAACVGAGAVVTRDVAPHTTVIGNPARPIKSPSNPQ
jgi:UDP-2-acetamido-3-amino-2,3-dideoxy-glucuronate N-acetyltransferase